MYILKANAYLQLLHVVEAFVVAVFGDEFIVLAAFNYLTFVDDVDDVGILDGGEAMGNGDGGAGLHQAVEGFLHQVLAFGVEGGCGLIEDEDGRVFEDGSGYAYTLPLTA